MRTGPGLELAPGPGDEDGHGEAPGCGLEQGAVPGATSMILGSASYRVKKR